MKNGDKFVVEYRDQRLYIGDFNLVNIGVDWVLSKAVAPKGLGEESSEFDDCVEIKSDEFKEYMSKFALKESDEDDNRDEIIEEHKKDIAQLEEIMDNQRVKIHKKDEKIDDLESEVNALRIRSEEVSRSEYFENQLKQTNDALGKQCAINNMLKELIIGAMKE